MCTFAARTSVTGGECETNLHRDLKDDDLKEYDLENYDQDQESTEATSMFGNVRQLAYHSSNAEDPYITLKKDEEDNSDDEEREELQIMPTDNLVLGAKVEDEVAHLEVYLYEDEADNLYVHHDIMLPAIPLAVEWINMPISKSDAPARADGKGNVVAIGTMDPDIEIWDLDVVDCMYPNAVLGQSSQDGATAPGPVDPTQKRKKKKKSSKINDAYHVDSVLGLASNRTHNHLLASASADTTIKLWDLNTCSCAKSYSYHTDKVCSLAWHPTEATILLSGSYDRTVVAADMRAPMAQKPTWGVESDIENVRWDPHDTNVFYVSTEQGYLHCFDARNAPKEPSGSKAKWRLQAHEKALSALSVNPAVPGFIVTGSMDRTVKIWNVSEAAAAAGNGPSMVVSRDLGVGKVFSAAFAPDEPVAFRLAVAGSKGAVQVWDTSTNKAVREAFGGKIRAPANGTEVKERLVGIQADDEGDSESDDDDEDDDEEGGQDCGWESMSE